MKGANTARGRRREKRRGAGKASPGSAGKMENKPVRMQGRQFVTNTSAVNYVVFNMTPAFFGDRATNMADMYAEWRPISIKVTSVPNASSAPTVFCLGISYPSLGVVTTPSTLEEMVDFPAFAIGTGLIGNPLPSLKVGHAFFKNAPLAWYSTQTALASADFELCGNLVIGQPNGLNSVIPHPFLIEWELEFRSMLDPSVSMKLLLDRARAQEEEKKEEFPPLVEGDDDVIVVTRTPVAGKSYATASTSQPATSPLAPGAPQRASVRR